MLCGQGEDFSDDFKIVSDFVVSSSKRDLCIFVTGDQACCCRVSFRHSDRVGVHGYHEVLGLPETVNLTVTCEYTYNMHGANQFNGGKTEQKEKSVLVPWKSDVLFFPTLETSFKPKNHHIWCGKSDDRSSYLLFCLQSLHNI